MKIVGFGYRKGVGKDFCTTYLVNKYGFRRLSFADPLKAAAREIFGFSQEQLYGDLKEEMDSAWGFSPRWCLQHLGTETMREFFGQMFVQEGFWPEEDINSIWIRATVRKLQKWREQGVVGVSFSDVRFFNEYQALRTEGGTLVKINRPIEDLEDPVQGTHASEAELDMVPDSQWDLVLHNVGDDYIQILDELMEQLEVPRLQGPAWP